MYKQNRKGNGLVIRPMMSEAGDPPSASSVADALVVSTHCLNAISLSASSVRTLLDRDNAHSINWTIVSRESSQSIY